MTDCMCGAGARLPENPKLSAVSRAGVPTAQGMRRGFRNVADAIRLARRELRVSRAEFGLVDVVVPSASRVPLSLQGLNDWICRTSTTDAGRGPDDKFPGDGA